MSSDPVVIVGIARTPMGGLLGDLSPLAATELGSIAISGALARAGVDGEAVDEVLMGNVLAAGLGQAPARQAMRGAGLPDSATATTVSKVCGSGMKSIMQGHDAIAAGSANIIVAGGMESMTNAPHLLPTGRTGIKYGEGKILDHMANDGLQNADDGQSMGAFAEMCAEHYQFTREAQDAFAIASTERAQAAIANGAFSDEIEPVTIKSRRGDVEITTDEQPPKARLDKVPALRPAFKKDGTITAATSSSISDGAAALVMMRASEANSRGLKPLATIKAHASHAQAPEWFTTAPVDAMRKVLDIAGWTVADVDLFEINEAFACVTMAAMHELNLDHAKVNVNGGACALGHPIGASGSRIVVTLLNALKTRGLSKGVASLCIGGGEATALAVELN